ncbi:MAG: sigma-70 family RNA polymerase sigma factor [Candidatus Eremiobacteraeota bacterium]|nr:sigma-70 family RNA polymerase sigma factor [Candidatus Eremiobacteraeota bacterium]
MVNTALRLEGDSTFNDLFAREYTRIVAIARRVVGASEAEDVAQEVFAAYSGAPGIHGRPEGWLRTAAVHIALNHLRTHKRAVVRELANFRLSLAFWRERETQQDPQYVVASEQERKRVRDVLLRLSLRDAEILVLRHSGLSYRDIATAFSINVTHVGTRLARAERALKKELENESF